MALTLKQTEDKLRATRDLLLVVGIKVSLAQLRELSPWERSKAADWAVRVFLAASDNKNLKIPAKPRCLASFSEVAR